MQANTKRKLLSVSNLVVIIGVICASFGLIMLFVQTTMIGKFETAIAFIVMLYLLFMGSDVLCRRYLRPNNTQ